MILIDTEETIYDIPTGDLARYVAIGEEIAEDAWAILATCGHLLTGHETQVCENATGIENDMLGIPMYVIENLRNTFPCEIATYKNNN